MGVPGQLDRRRSEPEEGAAAVLERIAVRSTTLLLDRPDRPRQQWRERGLERRHRGAQRVRCRHSQADQVAALDLEWTATASTQWDVRNSLIGVDKVSFTEWPVYPLAAALDAPATVTWKTSGEIPFTGRTDLDAKGETSAYVGLLPQRPSWLTVETVLWQQLQGVATGGMFLCRLEGCGGVRVAVRWPDGRVTYPCTKGMTERMPGIWQIT